MKNKCYHPNFVDIFNSNRGCAYCPDCGKSPLSVYDIGIGILQPGFDAIALSLAKDILATCPKPKCKHCKKIRKDYPYLK